MTAKHSYQSLTARLREVRHANLRTKELYGIMGSLGVFLASGLIFVAIEALFYAPIPVRVGLLVTAFLGMLSCLIWLCVRPLVHRDSLEVVALRLEGHFPQLKQRLISVLQLWKKREDNPEGYSLQMIDALAQQTEAACQPLSFYEIIDRRWLARSAKFLGSIVLVWLVVALSLPESIQGALYRVLHPLTTFVKPLDTTVVIEPGDCQAIKGQDVAIGIFLRGRIPKTVQIAFKPEHRKVWREINLVTHTKDTLNYVFENARASLDYVVTAGDARTPQFRLTVIDRPAVRQLRQRYDFPAYTGLSSRLETEQAGDISAIVGTRVSFEIISSKALKATQLVFSDTTELACRVEGRIARTMLQVKKSGTYHIELMDIEGITNAQPIEYRVLAIPDEAPTVRIAFPGENTDLGESMLVGLVAEAVDDFGFSAMNLVYRWANHKPQKLSIPIPDEGLSEIRVDYVWDLNDMDLMPEDQVKYYIEVYDNDTISGPKLGRSAEFVVRFPSIYEIFQEVEQQQQQQIDELARIVEEGKRMQKHLEEVRRELLKEENLDWEKKQDVEAALKKQRQMAEDLKKISDRIGETMEKLEKSGIVTLETLEKLAEIQRLVAELTTPELKEAMTKMQKAIEQVSAEKLQQAMKEFSLSQEEYQRKLERTLSILKRVQIEQKMDAVIKETEELIRRQEGVNERVEPSLSMEEASTLAQEEEKVARDTDRLQDDIRALGELMEGVPGMPQQQIQELAEQMEADSLSGQMQDMAQMLSAGQCSACMKAGQCIAKHLQSLQSGLSSARGTMQENMMAEIIAELKRAMTDLLFLSERQESVITETQNLHRSSLRFGELAETEQWLLQGTSGVADDLYNTSQKTFFVAPVIIETLGRSLENMQGALKGLEERRGYTAGRRGQDAMTALNRTVLLLRQAISNMQSGQSATGFGEMMEQLGKMAQQQQGINKATESLFGKGSRLSLEDRATMARLAAEQEAVRQGLEQLQKQLSGRRNILGRLDQMGSEMNEVIKDLKRKRVSRKTIDRQKQILSRLLDAQRSIRERGYSRQRKSRTGEEYVIRSPGSLPEDLGERENALRQDLLKALKEGYPKEYEELIRHYFEALARERMEE